jgi:glutamate-5-semialdehyde dehydrogenase
MRIADNAKTQRYGTCNTAESLLVHARPSPRVLGVWPPCYIGKGVELRGCDRARALVPR